MNTQIRRKQDGHPSRYGIGSHACDVSAETLVQSSTSRFLIP